MRSVSDMTNSIAAVVVCSGLAVARPAAAQTVANVPADPGFTPSAGAYALNYEADLLGTPVITLGVELNLRRDSYAMSARIGTVGLADWVMGWKQKISSQGRIASAAVQPDQHRNVSEFRGRARKAEIDYVEGRVAQLRVEPPPGDDGHDEFNEKQRAGTRDPMSAILALIYAANQGQGCSGTTGVFDGRRRYDLIISQMPEAAQVAKSGLACAVQFVNIAGEKSGKPPNTRRRPDPNDRARVWMAPVTELNVMAPVRIEFDSALGTMTLVLRQANFTTDEASAAAAR